VSDDIIITANKDNSASLVIGTTAANATYEIMGTDQAGIVTEAVVEANGETLHSSGDSITIDLDKINSELVKLDVDPILSSSGDFLVTLVVSGLRINERDGSVTTVSNEYTVEHGADSVTGNGIRGYISVRL